MSQNSFQINISDCQSSFSALTESDIRQFTWSATSEPFFYSLRSFTSFNIFIDSALLSYQSIVLSFTEFFTLAAFIMLNTRMKLNSKDVRNVWLTEDENMSLVQLCLKNKLAYGLQKSSMTFWADIWHQFVKNRQQNYVNLKWQVNKLIEERLVHLSMLKTENEDQKSTFIKAIDDWITVVNSHNHDSEKKKKIVKQQIKKIQTEERVRDNLMQHMGHKCSYFFFFSSFISFSENLKKTQTSIPSSILFCSTFIISAVFTVFCSEWQCLKQPHWIQQLLTVTINDTSIRGLKTALTKYVKVLTVQSQHQNKSEDMRAAERTAERVTKRMTERTAESVKDSEVLSCLNRLEKTCQLYYKH